MDCSSHKYVPRGFGSFKPLAVCGAVEGVQVRAQALLRLRGGQQLQQMLCDGHDAQHGIEVALIACAGQQELVRVLRYWRRKRVSYETETHTALKSMAANLLVAAVKARGAEETRQSEDVAFMSAACAAWELSRKLTDGKLKRSA